MLLHSNLSRTKKFISAKKTWKCSTLLLNFIDQWYLYVTFGVPLPPIHRGFRESPWVDTQLSCPVDRSGLIIQSHSITTVFFPGGIWSVKVYNLFRQLSTCHLKCSIYQNRCIAQLWCATSTIRDSPSSHPIFRVYLFWLLAMWMLGGKELHIRTALPSMMPNPSQQYKFASLGSNEQNTLSRRNKLLVDVNCCFFFQ